MSNTARLNAINSSRVLKTVWHHKNISRIEIAEKLNMDRSTITKITSSLLEKRLLLSRELEEGREHLGRRPTGLEINNDFGVLLGIEIQTQLCRTTVLDLNGALLSSRLFPFQPDKQSLTDILVYAIKQIRSELENQGKRLLGIGIGASGIINPYSGQIRRSNPLNIHTPFALGSIIEKEVKIPVLIENDANCCGWGELVVRRQEEPEDFLTVLGEFRSTNIGSLRARGIGVGMGIAIGNNIFYGKNFTAGEFRSIYWKPDNITQFSLTNAESMLLPDNRELLLKLLRELAVNIALLINSMNLTSVVFAGDLAYYREELISITREEIQKNWLYDNKVDCTINFSAFDTNAVAYGAGARFLRQLFSIPGISGGDRELKGIELFERIA